ncbi:hypothetical protein KAR91_75105 [Candidatus Pacearchaeota archaeon]|nr:hypothetical protein [Candidatus Pacearchaeota archaeon]
MGREITGDEFHEILTRIVVERVTISELLSIPDVYEALSEKYNNEVLDAWEQDTFDLNLKLFSFTIQGLVKDQKCLGDHLVLAKNYGDAQNKTFWYCRGLHQDDPNYRFDVGDEVHCFDSKSVYLTVENLKETTKSAWAKPYRCSQLSQEEYLRINSLRPLSYKDCIMVGCLNFLCKFTTCNPGCSGYNDSERYIT